MTDTQVAELADDEGQDEDGDADPADDQEGHRRWVHA